MREPDQITFRPDLRIVRDGGPLGAWCAHIGDYSPDCPAGFGATIAEALMRLANDMATMPRAKLEAVLGKPKLG